MEHIIVVGDTSSTNLGDPILTHCCEYLVRQALGEAKTVIEVFDIAGRKPTKNFIPTKSTPIVVQRAPSCLSDILNTLKLDAKALIKWYQKDKYDFLRRLSRHKLQGTTFIIAGGALISSSLFYALRLNAIVEIAERNNGRVIFNAVGIEKTIRNFGLAKYVVRHYLKQKEVVAFSTRDHVEDVPYLTKRKEFYLQTPDPGLLASEAYNIQRKESCVVGISVISYNAYRSVIQNEPRVKEITPDLLLDFWSSIIKQLQYSKIPFRILTNGGIADYEMALRLCQRMNLPINDCLLPMAKEPKVLIEQLSQFKIVIAHRLHALIISTSLQIPVIPVVWSDKVQVFANMIGNENAVWPSLETVSIFSQIVKPLKFNKERIRNLKALIIDYFSDTLI